jgi:transposase
LGSLSPRWMPKVTDQQRQSLEALTRSTNRGEADRARAIRLTLGGRTSLQIANRLGVGAEQVRHWRSLFKKGGTDALEARPHTGRPPTKGQAALAVAEKVLETPLQEGIPWTCARLAAEVQRQSGVSISPAHLSKVLRKKGALDESARATRSKHARTKTPSSVAD